MSTFSVKVIRIRAIEPIENADAIELAVIGDYRSVVKKNEFSKGDLAVYIPEAALVPDWLLEKMGLTGRLAGKDKNRVKAVKLRGCLSQGILYPVRQLKKTTASLEYTADGDVIVVNEGDDVADLLKIVKWEPEIPAQFAGELYNAGTRFTINYDVENFKKFPDVLVEGEDVVFTEKLHGTFCGVGILPKKDANPKHWHDRIVVFSKGLGARGLCFTNTENNSRNVYIRALTKKKVFENLLRVYDNIDVPVFILGEVFGKGVQDLAYDTDLDFRVFDVAGGYRDEEQAFWPWELVETTAWSLGLQSVPALYKGPFSKEKMIEYTTGKESVSGKEAHIREGIVIKPWNERVVDDLGRVILKSVSEDYLLRKGGTEYN